jgi:hypothetical protein
MNHLAEKLGKNFWQCDLKRSKNNYKINYVNTSLKNKEPWEQIVDPGDKEVEYIKNPNSNIKTDKSVNNSLKKCPKLTLFSDIKLEGRNLFKNEFNNFIKSIDNEKKIFRLYKDPQESENNTKDLLYKEHYRPLSRIKILNKKN